MSKRKVFQDITKVGAEAGKALVKAVQGESAAIVSSAESTAVRAAGKRAVQESGVVSRSGGSRGGFVARAARALEGRAPVLGGEIPSFVRGFATKAPQAQVPARQAVEQAVRQPVWGKVDPHKFIDDPKLVAAVEKVFSKPFAQLVGYFNKQLTKFDNSKCYVYMCDITRDILQARFQNNPSLNGDLVGFIYRMLEYSNLKTGGLVRKIERGGQEVQASGMRLGERFLNGVEAVSSKLPYSQTRYLNRGPNSWTVAPQSKETHAKILDLLVKYSEKPLKNVKVRDGFKGGIQVRVFDSQGITKEIEHVFEIVADLIKKGKKVSLEIAVPYDNLLDKALLPLARTRKDPFTTQYFVKKFEEGVRSALAKGIPAESISICFKDMIGKMRPELVESLMQDVHAMLLRVEKEHKLPSGALHMALHLHETGHATATYKKAAEVAQRLQRVLYIDAGVGKSTEGFANMLELMRHFRDSGIHGYDRVTPGVERIFEAAERMMAHISRTNQHFAGSLDTLSPAVLRAGDVPGGGSSLFVSDSLRVLIAAGVVERLKVNVQNVDAFMALPEGKKHEKFKALQDAMAFDPEWSPKKKLDALLSNLSAIASAALGEAGGDSNAVTPGHENRKNLALFIVKRFSEAGLFDSCENFWDVLDVVLDLKKHLSSAGTDLFEGCPDRLAEFMRGEFPSEMEPSLFKAMCRVHLQHVFGRLPDTVVQYKETLTLEALRERHGYGRGAKRDRVIEEAILQDHCIDVASLTDKQKREMKINRAHSYVDQYRTGESDLVSLASYLKELGYGKGAAQDKEIAGRVQQQYGVDITTGKSEDCVTIENTAQHSFFGFLRAGSRRLEQLLACADDKEAVSRVFTDLFSEFEQEVVSEHPDMLGDLASSRTALEEMVIAAAGKREYKLIEGASKTSVKDAREEVVSLQRDGLLACDERTTDNALFVALVSGSGVLPSVVRSPYQHLTIPKGDPESGREMPDEEYDRFVPWLRKLAGEVSEVNGLPFGEVLRMWENAKFHGVDRAELLSKDTVGSVRQHVEGYLDKRVRSFRDVVLAEETKRWGERLGQACSGLDPDLLSR